MFRKLKTDMQFVAREEEILQFWEKEEIRHKAWSSRKGQELYTVYDGPPTANGKPHSGHVLTRAIKDVIPRHRRMKGYDIQFKAGWDTHGLPVELEVEKQLGLDGKDQIETYGVEAFVKKCKESVWTYKDKWEQMSDRLAYWADMEDPYVTYENNYIESEWWALKEMWSKDLIYNGHKIVPYCPRCGTALSSHEVAQGYQDITEKSAYVRFKVQDRENTWITAWTTTPWTLPSNVALVVNPAAEYVLIELHDNEEQALPLNSYAYASQNGHMPRYIIAKELADRLFEGVYTILETFTGSELVGLKYEPLFPYAIDLVTQSKKEAYKVLADDYVTLEDGTGIVHTAPAFGEDDYRVGRKHDLAFVQFVDTTGKLTEEVTDFAGMDVKAADPQILNYLEKHGLLLHAPRFEHSYPHCWRCDTPLIYYARNAWFIEMTKVRDRLLANNQLINWLPASVRDGRFGNFLENVVDWGLSRERYWGTPFPMWQCESCHHEHMIGSIEELKSMSDNCPEDIELHKPYIDQVHLTCPSCQGQMTRVPEVIDGWFDSGAMPFAQYHYPFENEAYFEERFPADFISEAQDQTRGWFYSLLAISTVIFDKPPYHNVIVMGLVQDEKGQKMSKHKGNVVDPWTVLDKYGSDAIRWYFYANSNPWLPSRYSDASVTEYQRKFMGTFWNTLAFFTMYAGLDGYSPLDESLPKPSYTQMDQWLISTLQTVIETVDSKLEAFDITAAARALQNFVDELSNWYVRRSRDRFWGAEMTSDKTAAYETLFRALETVTRLMAPFTPFIAEQAWLALKPGMPDGAPESVHLSDYPMADSTLMCHELEEQMSEVQRLVTLGHAARNSAQIKTRQPLSEALVSSKMILDDAMLLQVADELNVKTVRYIQDEGELLAYQIKPQLKTLGKRLGSRLNDLRSALATIDTYQVVESLKKQGNVSIDLGDGPVNFEEDDLIIESHAREGFSTATEQNVTVALNLELTDTLVDEGLMREIISKIQTMRKEADFEVEDRISVQFSGDDDVSRIMRAYHDVIAKQVLATEMQEASLGDSAVTWTLNGHTASFVLTRTSSDSKENT